MAVPPDVAFAAAIGLLGVVMLSLEPGPAVWLGALIVLAALTAAEQDGANHGHSFIADLMGTFGFGGKK